MFWKIWTNLHLNDNKLDIKEDKFYKMRKFTNVMKTKFQNNWNISSRITIDEMMIKFKGLSNVKQYLPLKPTKWGYKLWCFTDAETDYLFNFKFYSGKDKLRILSLGEHVVLQLTNDLNLEHKHLYFDNLFTGFNLLKLLAQKKIAASGTINPNRKNFPLTLKEKERLDRGEFRCITCGYIVVTKWQDNKPVFFATNYICPAETTIFRWNKGSNENKEFKCQNCVKKYQKYMKGVDLLDQRIGTYDLNRKSKRNWIRIFHKFIQISLYNSFLCYCEKNGAKLV